MISSEAITIGCSLSAAITWGVSDFCGGLATKRSNVQSVIIVSQFVGATLLTVLAFFLADKIPTPDNLLLGGFAGISVALGLVALYRGLALGRMGIVAPISAVVGAIFPVIFALFNEGFPSTPQLFGFCTALISVWLLSHSDDNGKIQPRELFLPVAAGLGFGLFFILIDQVSSSPILWPLVAAKIASIGIMLVFVLTRQKVEVPAINQIPVIALVGIFDACATGFFALATRLGRLDISAVLSSLYPVATILLAWIILKERLTRKQWGGVIAALLALVLVAS